MENFAKSKEYKKIFNFYGKSKKRLLSRESSWLEFKESFNWNAKSKYAKTIASFSNNKGGYIVYGVVDSPRKIIGMQNDNFIELDEAKISEYLNSIFSPEIVFEKFFITANTFKVGILRIHKSIRKPVICIKSDGNVREGEIYFRYNGRSEKIKYPELIRIIEEIKANEKKSWMEHFQNISKIGVSNVAMMDVVNGKIEGAGGTLIIDEKLIPKIKFIKEGSFQDTGKPVLKLIGNVKPVSVSKINNATEIGKDCRITDNPNAPEVRINEKDMLKQYPLNYNNLTKHLKKKYSNFLINPRFHRLKRNLERYTEYCIERKLDPRNPKSTSQKFYSLKIIDIFDQEYLKK